MSQDPANEAPETLNDLLPTTPDGREERLAELKRLFPDLFTNEGRINPDELKQLVEPNEVHESERYEFKWYGKAASKREAFTPTTATLVYDESRSVNPDKADGNMIIEGENLESLKLLLNAYRGQVKCIYIDPPYNTGKDFIYRDNYKKDKANYWEETGSTEEGIKLDSNPDSSGRYHSDWLSMVHSRLIASRALLNQDGFVIVSIDDDEVTNLRKTMNEVYGEENFVGSFVWDKNRKNDAKLLSVGHEYMLVFAKDKESLKEKKIILRARKPGVEELKTIFEESAKKHANDYTKVRKDIHAHYKTIEKNDLRKPLTRYRHVDEQGPFRSDGNINWPGTGGPRYNIKHVTTKKNVRIPRSGWRYPTEERFWEEYEAGRIVFGKDETTTPSVRTNIFEQDNQVMGSVHFSYAQTSSDMFDEIFGTRVFENPKHFIDLADLIDYFTDPNDLVLDFFGGSGSFAHGVLYSQQRAELLGRDEKRRFILVQIPEVVDRSKNAGVNATKLGLEIISGITIERVKRSIEGYGDDPQPIPDAGFKVYKLQKSNFPRCEFKPDPEADEADNVAALRQYIEEKEAAYFLTLDEDGEQAVFDEVLLKNGFQLHYTRTLHEDFPDNTIYEISDGRRTALVCLAWNENIKDSTIKALRDIAENGENGDRPFFICLERSLSTTAKWNLKHFLGTHFNAF
jgi:adenine-specific DNA-methyltransferase